MATITHRLGSFSGHVGPVRFVNGVAETDDADMVAYFAADPDTYDVQTDEVPLPDPGPQFPELQGDEDPDHPED